MQLDELVAETIVNKIAGQLHKEVMLTDLEGDVLASTDLAKTHKNYSKINEAIQKGKITDVVKGENNLVSDPLATGVILPLMHNNEKVGGLYIQDEPENYNKYASLIKTMAELILHQTLIIDNIPYKGRIRDNFIFSLLNRKISWDDPRIYDEAELLDIGLQIDKIVMIIHAPNFWQAQFNKSASSSEDERQDKLHEYKKKIYEAVKNFFKEAGGIQISYFGNDIFAVLINENGGLKGNQMVEELRSRGEIFNKMLQKIFEKDAKRIMLSVGNFYRGKEGTALAYEEAKMALQIGSSLGDERALYHIDDFGMFAILTGGPKRWKDSFVKNLLTQLLAEKYLFETIEIFFNQNMSLTQAAKKLGIHRNTLLYRLSKVKEITGLDPRKFNDAIKLKFAAILSFLQEKEQERVF
jgi:carbohydrate diacid regulator